LNPGGDSVYTPPGFNDFQAAAGIGTFDIYDIAVDPADFNHVLLTSHSAWAWGSVAYGNGSGVIESTDGGTTWRACAMVPAWGTGTNVWFLNNGGTWLLGTQADGFWRTADSGNTWTLVSTMCISHGGSQLYRAKNGVLYAACSNGIIRSTDNGMTWAPVGPLTFCGSVYGDGNYMYSHQAYGGGYGPFYRTPETDGVNWGVYTQGGSWTAGPFEMAFDSLGQILYASTWGNGFLGMKVAGATAAHDQSRAAPAIENGVRKGPAIVFAESSRMHGAADIFDIRGHALNRRALPARQAMIIATR
jgi:hypothetical protein